MAIEREKAITTAVETAVVRFVGQFTRFNSPIVSFI